MVFLTTEMIFLQLALRGPIIYCYSGSLILSLFAQHSSYCLLFFFCWFLSLVINFTNFMDGLDGLVAGCIAVDCFSALGSRLHGPFGHSLEHCLGFVFKLESRQSVHGRCWQYFLRCCICFSVLQSPNWSEAFALLLVATPFRWCFCVPRRLFAGQQVFSAHRLHLFQRPSGGGLMLESRASTSLPLLLFPLLFSGVVRLGLFPLHLLCCWLVSGWITELQSLSPWHCVSELQVFTVVFPWYGRWIGPTPVKGPQDCAYHHRCSVAPAGCLAQFLVAFGPSVPSHFSGFWLWMLPAVLLIGLPLYGFTGHYKGLTRYVGSPAFYRLACRNGVLVLLLAGAGVILRMQMSPYSSWFLLWLLLTSLTGAMRFALRDLLLSLRSVGPKQMVRVAIYGAGEAGAQLSAALRLAGNHQIVTFLDDSPLSGNH